MIEGKEIPSEYVNIRQVWLKQIDRCAEAISHRYMKNSKDQYSDRIGTETVVESVVGLYTLLVDYGEATIKSDVKEWEKIEYPKYREKYKEETNLGRFKFYRTYFDFIVETLHKYNMLFESQPEGYSNVEMKSV